MARASDSRERMVRTAAQLLRRQGYTATGWRQVVRDSQTPWGSQAHHFPGGKVQLATEALQRAGSTYEGLLRHALAGRHPADAITAWAEAAASELAASGWANGCPIATVALETAHASDELADVCAAAFESWRNTLADAMVEHGVTRSEAGSLATVVLAGIEGALLLARANRDAGALRVAGGELSRLVRERTESAAGDG